MLFPMRSNTPFRMFRLLTVQGGSVHVDMRFNFEKCYNDIDLTGGTSLGLSRYFMNSYESVCCFAAGHADGRQAASLSCI